MQRFAMPIRYALATILFACVLVSMVDASTSTVRSRLERKLTNGALEPIATPTVPTAEESHHEDVAAVEADAKMHPHHVYLTHRGAAASIGPLPPMPPAPEILRDYIIDPPANPPGVVPMNVTQAIALANAASQAIQAHQAAHLAQHVARAAANATGHPLPPPSLPVVPTTPPQPPIAFPGTYGVPPPPPPPAAYGQTQTPGALQPYGAPQPPAQALPPYGTTIVPAVSSVLPVPSPLGAVSASTSTTLTTLSGAVPFTVPPAEAAAAAAAGLPVATTPEAAAANAAAVAYLNKPASGDPLDLALHAAFNAPPSSPLAGQIRTNWEQVRQQVIAAASNSDDPQTRALAQKAYAEGVKAGWMSPVPQIKPVEPFVPIQPAPLPLK